jgi:hypothetical protein
MDAIEDKLKSFGSADSVEDKRENPVKLEDFTAYRPKHTYIWRPTGEAWAAESINACIRPIVVGKDKDGKDKEISATKWLDQHSAVEQMTWMPGEEKIVRDRLIDDEAWRPFPGARVLNLYRPAIIVPKKGDATLWLNHVGAVFGEDVSHIIKFLAQRVQKPGEKINHALGLGGAQGIGKDTLLEPVKQAVGPWNWQEVSPKQMMETRFNGYLRSTVLRVSEARDLGESDRFAFYDHMKTVIAAPPNMHRVDEKNTPEHSVPNVCGVIITTNHKVGGIHLPEDDRRHFIGWSDLAEGHFSPEYFTKLHRWYAQGGNEIVAEYLMSLDISDFDPKAPPPKTEAFWEMVNASRPAENAELADVLDTMGRPAAITLDQVKQRSPQSLLAWLEDKKNSRAIPRRIEDCGYESVRNRDAKDGYWVIAGRRLPVYANKELSTQERLNAIVRLRDAA